MRWVAGVPMGSRAWLLESARILRQVEEQLVTNLVHEGFAEVILPVVDFGESESLLGPPAGRAEVFRFLDPGGELLALRSDFTQQLARLLAPHLPSLKLPLELVYRGEVYRRPDSQGAREAQIFQVGAERLAPQSNPESPELRMLEVCVQLLESLDLGRFQIVVGLAGVFDEWAETRSLGEEFALVVRALIRRERRALRDLAPELLPVVEQGVPENVEVLGTYAASRVTQLERLLNEIREKFPSSSWGIDLAEFADFSPRLGAQATRGLRAYYDGVVFRAYVPNRSAPIGSGGRYDRLFEAMGVPVAAAGFALRSDWIAECRLQQGGVP